MVDENGCALEQRDSDGDNVYDHEDAFPNDPMEYLDSDGDGVPDGSQNMASSEDSGSGFVIYTLVAILILGALAGLGVMRRSSNVAASESSPFTQEVTAQGEMETQMLEQEAKTEDAAEATNEEWEENGVRWLRQPNGALYYLDTESNQWVVYQETQ